MPARDAGRQTVFLEITPSLTLSGWSVYSGSAYEVDLPRFIEAGDVAQLYRRVVGVRQNATDLEEVANAAAVVSGAGTWFWDEAAGVVYVRTVGSADPATFTMQAFVRYHFATEGRVVPPTAGDDDGAVYYLPWVTEDLPRLSRQVSDLLFGATVSESGDVVMTNGHAAWHTLIPGHNWQNKRAEILFGDYGADGAELARDELSTLATMIVQGPPVADEETATIRLSGLSNRLSRQIPPGRFRAADYPDLAPGLAGSPIPLLWGRATFQPPVTDVSGSGVLTLADSGYQTILAVHGVVAIAKADGARFSLTLTTHYTVNTTACTVTLTGTGGFNVADYVFEVDATGKPDPDAPTTALETFAAIVRDILETHVGVDPADIDSASFAQAALDAEAPLSVYLAELRTISSLFSSDEPDTPSLDRSVLGRVRQSTDGRWSLIVWNDGATTTAPEMRKKHFARFRPDPPRADVSSLARVYYGRDHSAGAWSTAEATDLPTRYLAETYDEAQLYTFLRNERDAEDHAQRTLLLVSAESIEIEFEEVGSRLKNALAGDFAPVTYSPAPVAGQAFDAAPLEITRLDISLSPTLQISGRLVDLRSIRGRIGIVTDDTGADWSTATEAEKAAQGFVSDDSGLIDPSDATTEKLSITW